MCTAAGNGNVEMMQLLLQLGVDVRWGKARDAALYVAARRGQLQVVKWLLEQGATDQEGNEALVQAAEQGHVEVLRLLLDKGADVSGLYGRLTLRRAQGHKEALAVLLSAGASDPD
jgi:ankyrin repeat protein